MEWKGHAKMLIVPVNLTIFVCLFVWWVGCFFLWVYHYSYVSQPLIIIIIITNYFLTGKLLRESWFGVLGLTKNNWVSDRSLDDSAQTRLLQRALETGSKSCQSCLHIWNHFTKNLSTWVLSLVPPSPIYYQIIESNPPPRVYFSLSLFGRVSQSPKRW